MTTILHSAAFGVAIYEDGTEMQRRLSPRPFLQARTLRGVPVTQLLAADHAHHYGVSAALPDVNGVTFWGGRTFVPKIGSVLLDNHGNQAVLEQNVTGNRIEETLEWLGPDNTVLLKEKRTIVLHQRTGAWRLDWRSDLRPGAGDVSFGSPHTNGRDGAFYGGIFWRTPFAKAQFLTNDGEGIQNAHGSSSPWLAVISDAATLVAWTPPGFPWFVRDDGYIGFCPAVAIHGRRHLPANKEIVLEMRVAACDGQADSGWITAAIHDLSLPAPAGA